MAAWLANNPTFFNAAFNGAFAGLMSLWSPTDAARSQASIPTPLNPSGFPLSPQDDLPATYAPQAAFAVAFAKELDAQIGEVFGTPGPVTNVSAGNATLPPTSAVVTATQNAYVALVFSLCFSYFTQRSGGLAAVFINGSSYTPTPGVPSFYSVAADAIAAQFAAAQAALNAANVATLV